MRLDGGSRAQLREIGVASVSSDVDDGLLAMALAAAVPLHIHELRLTTDPPTRLKIAREAGEHIAHHGDAIMYRSKPGATAEAFNHLARGLACAAFQPGGVTFAGQHWCVDHGECEAAR